MAGGPRPLRCQALLHRLARFGIVVVRQSGSHHILLKPERPGSKRGPTYPVSCHHPTDEISLHIVRAVLRAFSIDEEQFWDD